MATSVSPFVELSAGMGIVPGFSIKDDYSVYINEMGSDFNRAVEGKLSFSRTTFDLKASIYPFGGNSTFFVAAGLSMGGKELGKVSAHSDEVAYYMAQNPGVIPSLDFEDYHIVFNKQGNANADVRVNSVRPYLGLGVGRLVPKRRVGFRAEFGCHFMGKAKFYQNGSELSKPKGSDEAFYEKISVYPVLRLTLTGRIL